MTHKRVVITYGTFDLFHEGHQRLLSRAKALGDKLIVGVTTDNYDESRGKLNVQQSLMERIENVRASGLADEIIIEEYEGQKVDDALKHNVSVFAIGSDWLGKFDYLSEFCEVVYLERTRGISSTQLRNTSGGILSLGVLGCGRIANRFATEARFVSGVEIQGVFGRCANRAAEFASVHQLSMHTTDYEALLEKVSAVYIATPHLTHYQYARRALEKGVHVLCEKPLTLSGPEARELYALAEERGLVLLEAIKTAYSNGFNRLVSIAKSGLIGELISVDAAFTKLVSGDLRELDPAQAGGSVAELASYPLLAAVKLMGTSPTKTSFFSYTCPERQVDLYSRITLEYGQRSCCSKVGLGVKSEGDLVVSGTKGYLYVPAPWWKTEYFEVRYENYSDNRKFFYKFDGDGLRYELAEFLRLIRSGQTTTHKLLPAESIAIVETIQAFREWSQSNGAVS